MSKYRILIEVDVDFDKIFSEIPEKLFTENEGCDEDYELETIYDCLKNSYLYALNKNMDDLVNHKEDGLYAYIEHHNKCMTAVSKCFTENVKVEKI